MAGRQAARGRNWTRILTNVGLVMVAAAAVTEMVTAGSARPLVGVLLLVGLVALIPAGVTWLMESRQRRAAGPAPEQQPDGDGGSGSSDEQSDGDADKDAKPSTVWPTTSGLREKWAGGGGDEPVRAAETPAAARPSLPRLSELSDTALGATPTRYTARGRHAPYVKRPAADGRLAALLKAVDTPYPFVIVVGPSKSGKSRTALEAVRSMFGSRDPSVVIPDDEESLAELMRSEPPLPPERQPWVVWLDDLTAAELAHLSADVLDRASQRAVLVATMTEGRWNQIVGSRGDVTAIARGALERATTVPLEFELTAAERAEAEQMYPQERMRASLAETLVGGAQLVEKLRSGREDEPAGFTIVQAAVDARRAGLNRPITEAELRNLYPLYLRRVRMDLDPTTALFESGMEWATDPVDSGVALLRPTEESAAYEVFDHVVAFGGSPDSDIGGPIPDAMWRELIAAVPTDDAFAIGIGACVNGNPDAAAAAFRKVSSDHSGQAPQAALSLGMLLREHGDVAGAKAAYQRAVDSGHADVVPRAALNLGLLLREQGDTAGAKAAYQRAVDSGHTDVVPRAALNLGLLLREQGDTAGAKTAYQRAVDSGHTEVVPVAALNLGQLLRDDGDTAGAEAAYQRAVDSHHADVVPFAALNLGALLKERGDNVRAQAAYQRAIDSGRTDVIPVAALNLGMLFAERGDNVRAQAAYQRAVDSGRTDVVPVAALNLGKLLAEQGDADGAEAAYQRAIDSGDADIVPTAALHHGTLLAERGELGGAEAAYHRAIDSGHRDVAPRAANNLGVLLAGQDDTRGAQAAYRQAIDSGHHDVAPTAANNLGMLLANAGDAAGAQVAYQQAIDSGHRDVAPRAALNLGMLLSEQGNTAGARTAYQQAIDSEHPDVMPRASINLGALLAHQGDEEGARAAFHRAIDAGYVDINPVGSASLHMALADPEEPEAPKEAAPPAPPPASVAIPEPPQPRAPQPQAPQPQAPQPQASPPPRAPAPKTVPGGSGRWWEDKPPRPGEPPDEATTATQERLDE